MLVLFGPTQREVAINNGAFDLRQNLRKILVQYLGNAQIC